MEIMEKPSAYASNQTKERKTYREFCEDAGWDYVGSTGYLHISVQKIKKLSWWKQIVRSVMNGYVEPL